MQAGLMFCLSIQNTPPNYDSLCTIPRMGTRKIKSEMRSFKSNENIHKKEGGSYYVVSANKASSVTL